MIVALIIVSAYAVIVTVLWRLSAASVDVLMGRWIKANGQFTALDLEHNKLCVKYSQALQQLEDARRKDAP